MSMNASMSIFNVYCQRHNFTQSVRCDANILQAVQHLMEPELGSLPMLFNMERV